MSAEYPEKPSVIADDQHARDIVRQNAKFATDKEQRMTLLQGIRLYPKAVAWSVLISCCICMEGYQLCLLRCVPFVLAPVAFDS